MKITGNNGIKISNEMQFDNDLLTNIWLTVEVWKEESRFLLTCAFITNLFPNPATTLTYRSRITRIMAKDLWSKLTDV